ncbi:putative proline-rich receptor-like protein kinase PERK3 [Iris pallida]|uniref:Proline-rich receptor-like protein kinase PERK3 n=1 Tax=Iris pallida TaxID=29817 RepID=A0AAX6H5G0_IRIPA|nr:putative proline-rich receptor-like protein kinase PERK3 [Iris pallida]
MARGGPTDLSGELGIEEQHVGADWIERCRVRTAPEAAGAAMRIWPAPDDFVCELKADWRRSVVHDEARRGRPGSPWRSFGKFRRPVVCLERLSGRWIRASKHR